jgi:hypothetical protein|tara:strand:+ start:310 stop:537 length:228 start_codon:yes stop_codon:yes gene_type:complete
MNLMPTKVSGITHPAISDVYLKSSFGQTREDVLVIETNNIEDDVDPYILGLVLDLNDLIAQAQCEVGKFDRIDIR